MLINTAQNHVFRVAEKLMFKPGMLAEIDIQTEKRIVLQYLLKPLKPLQLR